MAFHLLREAAANQVAKLENSGIGDRVKHLQPGLPAAQNPALRQSVEVTRDIGLGEVGRLRQIIHAPLSFLQLRQQAQAVRFAQKSEAGGNQFHGGGRHFVAGFRSGWHEK